MPKAAQLTTIGLALEAVYGTGLAPTKFFPAKSHDYKPNVQRILDEGKRGVNAKDFGAYLGHQFSELSYGGDFYPDVPPYFLYGILGTKAVTGAGPYTHTFTLGPTVPSLTMYDYYVANQRQMPGALVEEFTLRFGTTETTAIAFETKFKANLGAAATLATPTIGATAPWLGWQSNLTVAGVANTKLLNGELTLRRSNEQIWGANNTQDPNQFLAGPLEVTGRLNLYMDDDTDLARYTGGTKPITVLSFTNGTNIMTITMSLCDWEAVTIDRGSTYVKLDATIRGHYNATDAGPIKFVIQNSVVSYV